MRTERDMVRMDDDEGRLTLSSWRGSLRRVSWDPRLQPQASEDPLPGWAAKGASGHLSSRGECSVRRGPAVQDRSDLEVGWWLGGHDEGQVLGGLGSSVPDHRRRTWIRGEMQTTVSSISTSLQRFSLSACYIFRSFDLWCDDVVATRLQPPRADFG